MHNLFKSVFRTLLVVLLAFVFFTATSLHSFAKQHYSRSYHAPTVTPSIVYIVSFDSAGNLVLNYSFDVPPRINLPAPVVADNLYIKDAVKPNNLTYQPIRWLTLGLIKAQMNI